MDEIVRALAWIALLTVALVSYFLVLGVLFPRRVAKTQSALQATGGRSFWVGLVNFLFFGFIAFILLIITDPNANRVDGVVRVILYIPTFAILGGLVIALGFGLAGMANLVGERILPGQSPLKRTIWGTVLLSFACLLPLAGWFLMFPYVGVMGIGAFILGFFQRSE